MSHYYTTDGELVEGANIRNVRKDGLLPSVTTVLPSPNLSFWVEDVAIETTMRFIFDNEIDPFDWTHRGKDWDGFKKEIKALAQAERSKYATWGTIVHGAIEAVLKGDKDEYVRLGKWWGDCGKACFGLRRSVDAALRALGELRDGKILREQYPWLRGHGGHIVADFKFSKSKSFKKEWGVQLGAYCSLAVEEYGIVNPAAASILLSSENEGEYKIKLYSPEDCVDLSERFDKYLEFWRFDNEL